jgi:hypothetical protein
MAVRKLPPAGQAPRTPGGKRPPVTPGKTAHVKTALGRAALAEHGTQPEPETAPEPQGGPCS